MFGGDSALDYFWFASQMGLIGMIVLNWLGISWAQYQREVNDATAFTDSKNLTAMGVNLAYNILSFALFRGLQAQLCSVDYFEYYGNCYEDNMIYYDDVYYNRAVSQD